MNSKDKQIYSINCHIYEIFENIYLIVLNVLKMIGYQIKIRRETKLKYTLQTNTGFFFLVFFKATTSISREPRGGSKIGEIRVR
jgi:hypothetical protein